MIVAARYLLLLAVGFTLPIEGLGTVSIAGYPVGLNKASTAALLLFAVLEWLATRRSLHWNRKHPWVLAFAGGVLISGALAVLLRGQPPAGVAINLTSYFAVFLFCFLIPYVARDSRGVRVLLTGVAMGAVFSVLAGFLFDFAPPAQEAASGRYTGSTANPNTLASNQVVALPLTGALLFAASSWLTKILLVGAIGIELGGLIASLSRAGVVAVVAMGGLCVIRFAKPTNVRYLFPMILVAAAALLAAPAQFYDRLETMSTEERQYDGSIQKRVIGWEWGMRAFGSNPLMGVGLNQVGTWAHPHEPVLLPGDAVHNTWISIAGEMGLLGLVPFLGITLLTWGDFSRVRRLARREPHRGDPEFRVLAERATFCQIALAGAVVFSQFGIGDRSKSFWLLVGLSTALVWMAQRRAQTLSEAAPASSASPDPVAVAGPARIA